VKVLRYVAVDDCGRVVNPMVVEGQLHGGVAQGIGQALLESAQYDDDGQVLSSSFMGYPLPRARDVPPVEVHLLEGQTAINPLGARGVGEGGAVAAPPALVNAVVDALAPLGVRHIDMPLLPEKVLRAIRDAGQR
jgi:carbon-monoxide dehydrogenase large subunit